MRASCRFLVGGGAKEDTAALKAKIAELEKKLAEREKEIATLKSGAASSDAK